ncbi:MAG TPA: hypothetical protein VKK79_22040 [Candidatus Lokiarchaeia archaeon]|nr:hypothetical protein [Candidatus Lokiarchaeia archaeon]
MTSTQIAEPSFTYCSEYLGVATSQAPVLSLMYDLLEEKSPLKKRVSHDPATVAASANTLLGAMLTNGSLESMGDIYETFADCYSQQLQLRAAASNLPADFQAELANLCGEVNALHPFAHRTTVQGMLNGHTKESSDECLSRSFHECTGELDEAGYTPKVVLVNEDPHFAEFKPSFKNGEVRQVLIGGRTTLKTGYQFNLANITPTGLYAAIDLAPKRQANREDLGDLRYASTFGKAAERVQQAGISLGGFQADRGLEDAALFAVSQQHAWPTASGVIGALEEFTRGVFLVTPWTSTRSTKADLIAAEKFADVTVQASNLLRSQYAGNQPLVQAVLGPDPACKVPVETAVVTLRKVGGAWADFSPVEVQEELAAFGQQIAANAALAEDLKASYFAQLRVVCPSYKDRGLQMKLSAKATGPIAREPPEAWATRKQYNRAKRAGKTLQQKRAAFLRSFQVFEVGVDAPALERLKGPAGPSRDQLVAALKACCQAYGSRWCIESGYETIDYHFPLHFRGNSSDTHLRIYVLQATVFNSYRVAQIKHVGASKPSNWHLWDPENKFRCRRFSAADLRGFSARTYLLGLLRESLETYFCRSVV